MFSTYVVSGSAGASFPWSAQGNVTRRQWWLGHLSAGLLGWLSLVGGIGIILCACAQFGFDPGGIGIKFVTMAVVGICVLQFLIASNALCRRRLNERGAPHDLADAFIGLTALETALALNDVARTLLTSQWPLPAAPQWIVATVSVTAAACLAALVLECGVFEHVSLTEIWRGRRHEAQAGGRI
jgi:uncharacterized membrane protein YhaH (DUF805 family)